MVGAAVGDKRFYAEYVTHEGELDIDPVWARDRDEAVKIAQAYALGKPINFVRVEKTWDAFKDSVGFLTPRHVLEAPEGSISVGDPVLYRSLESGPAEARPITTIVDDIIWFKRLLPTVGWRQFRQNGEAVLTNGTTAYGWQLAPALTVKENENAESQDRDHDDD